MPTQYELCPPAPEFPMEEYLEQFEDTESVETESVETVEYIDTRELYVTPSTRKLVGILGILLGYLGVHNFILGRYWVASIMLAITVCSLGTLAWITALYGAIEGLIFMCGNNLPNQKLGKRF